MYLLLFSIGTFDSSLVGLVVNQVYGACCSAQMAKWPKKQLKQYCKAKNMYQELTILIYILCMKGVTNFVTDEDGSMEFEFYRLFFVGSTHFCQINCSLNYKFNKVQLFSEGHKNLAQSSSRF